MSNKRWVAVYYGFFGLLGLYALLQENIVRAYRGTYDPVDLWSYFTYQSNLVVVVAALTCSLLLWRGKTWKGLDLLRGGATLYIIITGIVYAVLVNNADPAVAIDHHIMHQVMPVAMVVGWFIHRPDARIPYLRSLRWWLPYPLVYAVCALIHGASSGAYPYTFLDPTDSSYLTVFITIGVLILFAAVIARVLTLWGPVKNKSVSHIEIPGKICTDIMGHMNLYGDHFICLTCGGRIPDTRTGD